MPPKKRPIASSNEQLGPPTINTPVSRPTPEMPRLLLPSVQPSPPVEGATNLSPAQPVEAPTKKTRGPSRSKGTSKLIGKEKSKLNVIVNEGELHPYGANASRFANEIGIIIRKYAPLQVTGWSKVDDEDKEIIYSRIKDKFNLNLAKQPHIMNVVESHCANRYKNYRNKIHQDYKDILAKRLNPRNHQSTRVKSKEDWEWLCDNIFGNTQWQKRSVASIKNRSALPYVHRAGSKSFINHRFQETSDAVGQLGRIELFRRTHWNTRNGWFNEEVEMRYNQMVEMREQQQRNNEVVDEVAICTLVLGEERNGYVPGLGPIPNKGQSSHSARVDADVQNRVSGIEEQMQANFQRECDSIRTQMQNELSESRKEQQEMLRHVAALMDLPDEHPFVKLVTIHQPPPPPPPPPPAAPMA